MSSDILQGIEAIRKVYNKSGTTILKLIHEEGFPATKIGGEWVSTRKAVTDWVERRIELNIHEREKLAAKDKKSLEKKLKTASDRK